MTMLMKYESKKLFRQRSFLIGTFLLLLFTLFLFFAYSMNSSATFQIDTDSGQITGRSAVLYNKTVYEKYAGELTSKNVSEILEELQMIRQSNEESYGSLYNYPRVFDDINFLNIYITEAGYQNATELSQLYETPLLFDFPYMWTSVFSILHDASLIFVLFLVLALSPLFSKEYSSGAAEVILTTKYGRNKLIWAKFQAAVIFITIGVFLYSMIVLIICGAYHGGFTGWQSDIQTLYNLLFYIDLPIRMNCLQFFIFNVFVYWIASIGISALTCFCSALCKTSFIAIIASSVLIFIPMLVQETGMGGEWNYYLFIFPINLMNAQFVVNTTEISAMRILSTIYEIPVLAVIFAAISSFVFLGTTYRYFNKYQAL